MIAAVVVFVIDTSGVVENIKKWLGVLLNIENVGSIKPFDCSLCMTHHVALIYAICVGQFSLSVWAWICVCAMLTRPLAELFGALQYALSLVGRKINQLIDKLW